MKRLSVTFFLICVEGLFSQSTKLTFEEVRRGYNPSEILYLDRNNTPLQSKRIRFDYRSEPWVSLDKISPDFIRAVIYSEDKKFYDHNGVDTLAFVGSLWSRLFGVPLRGGSTITMQLVGLLDPELKISKNKRSFSQKLKQIQRAAEMEESWTKDEILSAYLNLVFFRGELRGIGSATRALFGKEPAHLTSNESYLLAILIRSPEAPISKVIERGCLLKTQMEDLKEKNCDDFSIFTKQTLFKGNAYLSIPNEAAQFINLINHKNANQLTTTISRTLQKKIQSVLIENLKPLRNQNVDDGAVLVLHNLTGEVLAYVANQGDTSQVRSLDLIQTRRQAGSTLKPFVYAQSFEERKLSPSSILNDAPIEIPVFRGIYRPLNYDKSYQGKVTVTQSLGSSLNIPAVRTLSFLDMGKFLNTLSMLGFSNLAYPEFYGPSLALGTADITLWELTNAYRTFANKGIYSEPILIYSKNEIQDLSRETRRKVYRESVAFLIQKILSDREARSLSFGWESNLSTPFYTAVKTGTSQDMRDNWCVGFSSEYTVGVWVGNAKGNPMRDVSGITGAGPIWREIIEYLHENLESISPIAPDSVSYDATKQAYYEKGMEGIVDSNENKTKSHIPPKIVVPGPGTIFAFDPDIPYPHQKILFRSNVYNDRWKWVLNQKILGSANEPFFWDVEKGVFVLELINENGKEFDKVNFEVR